MTDAYDPNEPIFGPDMPEEVKEQIKARNRYYKAMGQDNMHAIRSLLDDLDSEQLDALDTMLANMLTNTAYNVAFMRGQIMMRRWAAYDVCPCGEEHDPDKALAAETGPVEPVMEVPNNLMDQIITTPGNEEVEVGSDRWKALMDEYNLVLTGDDEGRQWHECKGCSKTYPSLQDRMLKPVGVAGCEGCQQKAMWG
jgi:hypothetical protein